MYSVFSVPIRCGSVSSPETSYKIAYVCESTVLCDFRNTHIRFCEKPFGRIKSVQHYIFGGSLSHIRFKKTFKISRTVSRQLRQMIYIYFSGKICMDILYCGKNIFLRRSCGKQIRFKLVFFRNGKVYPPLKRIHFLPPQ